MWIRSLTALWAIGIVIAAAGAVPASEVRVLSIPFKGPMDRIGPKFERTTGHRLAVKYAPSALLQKQIDAGEPFDVVLIFPTVVDQLIKQGKIAAGTRVDIASAGLGVAIKTGAAKPNLQTAEAFKRMLLASTSIAYAGQGPSGVHLIGLLDRLEIAQEVKPKLKPMSAGSQVVGPVARGEVEIGIVSIPFILAEPGVELAGPLPRELQDYVHYSSGVGISAQDTNAAKAFVSYFRQAESAEVLRAHGLEPLERDSSWR
jgi:molybdate transport system substrate-binding protein